MNSSSAVLGVKREERVTLCPARFPNPFVEQFRDGCLGDTDGRRDIRLSHSGVKEVLND